MDDSLDFSIVIPCFNEEDGIAGSLRSILTYLEDNYSELRVDVIVVDDGSLDNTVHIVEKCLKENDNIQLISFSNNKGRGAAMKAGLAACKTKYIMFLDSDLSYDVGHISMVIDHFKSHPNTDTIILSPYMKGGVSKNVPFSRLILSRTANWILSGFFSQKISTVTSMVRAYRTEVIKDLLLVENGKELHLEILRKLYLTGAVIVELPAKLIWKEKKIRGKRLNKRKVAQSAKKHLLYGFLSKPTRLLSKLVVLVFLFSCWEFYNIARVVNSNYENIDQSFWYNLWLAFKESHASSPQTTIIAFVSLVISIQLSTYLALFSILNMQHEEQMTHLLKIYKDKKS